MNECKLQNRKCIEVCVTRGISHGRTQLGFLLSTAIKIVYSETSEYLTQESLFKDRRRFYYNYKHQNVAYYAVFQTEKGKGITGRCFAHTPRKTKLMKTPVGCKNTRRLGLRCLHFMDLVQSLHPRRCKGGFKKVHK